VADDNLTVAEVAATLKLNQQTVRSWIDVGKLPALHVGRRVRIRREDFNRLLDESYSGVSQEPHSPEYEIGSGEVPPPQTA
jgi:excisionase family DNA binding protein